MTDQINRLPSSREIAEFLSRPLHGDNRQIAGPADLSAADSHNIVWVKSLTNERLASLEERRPGLTICDEATGEKTTVAHIVSDNPRRDFIKVLERFFPAAKPEGIHATAVIDPGACIGKAVGIGAHSVIGSECQIGEGCLIGPGVVMEGRVFMGRNCVVKANSVIGGQGFGFEYDKEGRPLHFPHSGRIVIEDDVWIGACSTIEIGALGETRLCRGCKIDDLVQVGHNVTVGKATLVMANSVLCGGVIVGERCWIAPNSVVKEKVIVGNHVKIGLGAVVLKDIADGLVVAGVPARPLTKKG